MKYPPGSPSSKAMVVTAPDCPVPSPCGIAAIPLRDAMLRAIHRFGVHRSIIAMRCIIKLTSCPSASAAVPAECRFRNAPTSGHSSGSVPDRRSSPDEHRTSDCPDYVPFAIMWPRPLVMMHHADRLPGEGNITVAFRRSATFIQRTLNGGCHAERYFVRPNRIDQIGVYCRFAHH